MFELFNLDRSPEQIASVVKISHGSIYHRIYAEIRAGWLEREHLRWERKKRRRRLPKRPPRDPSKLSIEKRPDLSSRAEFGHWEGDTVELVRNRSFALHASHSASILALSCLPRFLYSYFRLALMLLFFYDLFLRCDCMSFPYFLSLENAIFTSLFSFFNLLLPQLHFRVELTAKEDVNLEHISYRYVLILIQICNLFKDVDNFFNFSIISAAGSFSCFIVRTPVPLWHL